MSIFEYNEEEEIKKIRADEYSIGEEAGIEKGIAKGKAEDALELQNRKYPCQMRG